jgi:hypothetical protein
MSIGSEPTFSPTFQHEICGSNAPGNSTIKQLLPREMNPRYLSKNHGHGWLLLPLPAWIFSALPQQGHVTLSG